MKRIFFTLFAIISCVEINAQAFEMNKSYVSAGYGVVSFAQTAIKALTYDNGTNYKYKLFGPMFFKYEYGIAEKIGIGANIAYAEGSVSDQYTDYNSNTFTETVKYSSWSALARINFHLGDNEKVDPYLGFGLGYKSTHTEYTTNDPNNYISDKSVNAIPLGMDATFGCRFLFTEQIGAYMEVGMAKALLQFGLYGKF